MKEKQKGIMERKEGGRWCGRERERAQKWKERKELTHGREEKHYNNQNNKFHQTNFSLKKNEVKVNHKGKKLCEEKTVEIVKGLLL